MKYFTEHKKILTGLITGVFFFATGVSYVQAQPFLDAGTDPATSIVDELATPTTPTVPIMMPGGDTPTTPAPGIVASTIEDTLSEPPVTSSDAADAAFALDGASLTGNTAGDDALNDHFDCGITMNIPLAGTVGTGSLVDCIPVTVYYLIYKPASFLLVIAGKIFDYVLSLSINNEFIQQPFVDNIWGLMRDFANMAFIFILLYAGISTMLRMDDWTHTVKMVVIVALFINFSLLFTKVIIDAGNVLAVGIYSSLGTESTSGETIGLLPKREISGNLVAAFQPQNFIGTINSAGPLEGIVVFLISAAVNVAVAWAFFTIALVFIGRIVGFWVLMMFSPIAFVSIATPRGDIFKEWLHNLLNLSFVAPVFLIFMYVILKIIENMYVAGGMKDVFLKPTEAGFLADKLFVPVILAIMLVFAIGKARDYAKHMAGEFGEMGSNIGGKVMGVAGGVALGGAASIGRSALGGVASRVFDSGKLQKMATEGGAMGRFTGRNLTFATDKLRNASFDARNVGMVAAGIKQTGVDMGKAGGKGGFVKEEKAWIESEQKKAKLFEATKEGGAKIKADATVAAQKAVDDAKKVAEKNTGERERIDESFKKAQEAQRETAQQVGQAADKFTQAFKELEQLKANRGSVQDITKAEAAVATAQNELAAKKQTNDSANASLDSAKNFLAEAKKAEKEALDAVKKASETASEAGEEALKAENKKRRGVYAEHSIESNVGVQFNSLRSAENRRKLKDKIEEGPHEEDPYKKLLEQAKKDAAEALKKEGGEGGGSTSAPSGGGDSH